MYARYIKRILDFLLSFTALTLLSPIFLLLMLLGTIFMRGNPFFCLLCADPFRLSTGQTCACIP